MFQFVVETLKRVAQMMIYKYNMPDNMHFECAFFNAENKTGRFLNFSKDSLFI